MTIEYTQLTSCADIDQSKFVDGNYYLLAWGMEMLLMQFYS